MCRSGIACVNHWHTYANGCASIIGTNANRCASINGTHMLIVVLQSLVHTSQSLVHEPKA